MTKSFIENCVINVELIEDMLAGLQRSYEETYFYLRIKDYGKAKKKLADLGGTLIMFEKEVIKLSLPDLIRVWPEGRLQKYDKLMENER
jgi:hypothetical protein